MTSKYFADTPWQNISLQKLVTYSLNTHKNHRKAPENAKAKHTLLFKMANVAVNKDMIDS